MTKFVDKAVQWMTTALAVVLIIMVVMICIGVALRYIWGVSLLWLDESLVFAMVGIAFLGTIGVSFRDQHLRMSLLTQNLPPSVSRLLGILEQVLTIVICLFVVRYAFQGVSRLYTRGTLSNMAEVPLWLVQSSVLIGFSGMAGVALLRLVAGLRQGGNAK